MLDETKGTVLITGANGFVGSHLCRRLLDDNYSVIAGVREGCDCSLIEELDIQYRFGDITQPETLEKMTANVDYIIHNAGLTKTDNFDNFFLVNQIGTKNLLNSAMKNLSLKKFILISSLAGVGPSEYGQPLTEDAIPHPLTAYGRSKLRGEEEVLKFSDKINSVIIRPPAIYGPHDKEMLAFFETLNNRIKPYLGNLRRKIQLVHVDDLAYGVSLALKADTISGSVYYIAEKQSYSYCALIRMIRKAVGRVALPIYFPGWGLKIIAFFSQSIFKALGKSPMFTVEKANEILRNWEVSTDKAREELGYESQIDFPTGAQETVWWYREEGWL
ncbi:MAG: NAD(P)-dependent oxidoreductase [Candidatus Zixiibacteriota bacterium]